MPGWVKVAKKENDTERQLQLEDDGTLLLENIRNVFNDATTLESKNPENNAWRVVKCVNDVLHPPEESGWGDHIYIAVIAKGYKRKISEDEDDEEEKVAQPANRAIYILFEPPKQKELGEADFRDYFSEFGTVVTVNGQINKGFAFVTFDDESVPFKLYGKPVNINGVDLDIKEPENDGKEPRKLALLYKEDKITVRQIRDFFEQYGGVTDVYVTKPFRKYGFCTFSEAKTARELYDTSVTIEDVKVLCTKPRPKMNKEDKIEFGGPGGGHQRGHGGGGWGGQQGGWGWGGPGGNYGNYGGHHGRSRNGYY